MNFDNSFHKFKILIITEFAFFYTIGIIFWISNDCDILHLTIFVYIAIFVTLGAFFYALLTAEKKYIGRRISFIMVSLLLFITAIFLRDNLQIEGFFLSLIAGLYPAVLLHYLVAKIIGPLIINRCWCGWACWTMMILDFLPYKQGRGRISNKGWIRYMHFILSLLFILFIWTNIKNNTSYEEWHFIGVWWFLIANAIYYTVGIALAIILKDNRAFCKYVCPITVFLKIFSSFSILKIKGDRAMCKGCDKCTKVCPMDICIPEYTKTSRRVLSSECTMCLECLRACPNNALKISVGFDIGGEDILREQE
jgi:polyferredoxin